MDIPYSDVEALDWCGQFWSPSEVRGVAVRCEVL